MRASFFDLRCQFKSLNVKLLLDHDTFEDRLQVVGKVETLNSQDLEAGCLPFGRLHRDLRSADASMDHSLGVHRNKNLSQFLDCSSGEIDCAALWKPLFHDGFECEIARRLEKQVGPVFDLEEVQHRCHPFQLLQLLKSGELLVEHEGVCFLALFEPLELVLVS